MNPAKVYFSDVYVEALEASKTLPAKFKRMLGKFELDKNVKGKKVAIQMHLGGNLGYTTIHPFFVRLLVAELKAAGAKAVKVMDCSAVNAPERGYTEQTIGCPLASSFEKGSMPCKTEHIGFGALDSVDFSGEALDCDFFIDLAHGKGHGGCGYGGAIKNIAMGLVTGPSRGKLHSLEGGIKWDMEKCVFCLKCVDSCTHNALQPDKETKTIKLFAHHCTYCQHCVMACKHGAVVMGEHKFEKFSEGMAVVASKFLNKFKPEDLLFITFLKDITIYCDCWGFSTPPLVPDIGIIASRDIAAVEKAALDMIKTENFLPSGLPRNYKLLEREGHLLEKIHGKNPFLMAECLEKLYPCTTKYELERD